MVAAVVILVIARSFAFVWWPDVHFDADQAVTGLMARHLIEGRAFPVFQYAQEYVLVIESWLAAPVMAIWPGSIAALRSVPVAMNVAHGGAAVPDGAPLASRAFTQAPLPMAFLATLPVALPGPMTSADLTDALGMNIEPLLFAILLWRWRRGRWRWVSRRRWPEESRVHDLCDRRARGARSDPLRHRSRAGARPLARAVDDTTAVDWPRFWRGRVVAVVCFAITWAAIGVVKQYSSPFGPGTTFGILADSRDNTAVAASAMCIVPAKMPGDLWTVASKMLPLQLGAGDERLETARLYAHAIGNYSWLWPPLAIVLLAGVALGLVRAYRRGPSPATYFGVYLILIGAQAVLVYALTRCGNVSVFTLRYTLLVLLAPAGAIILALERESRRGIRAIVTVTVIAWASVCAFAHARLIHEYANDSPRAAYRELADYLDSHDIRFIVTDYWTGYHVAFLTAERVKALTDFERVHEYTLAVRANLDRAMEVRRNTNPDQPCAGTLVGGLFCVCPPQTQTDRTR